MLDKNGNKLLKSSPFKMGAKEWWFGSDEPANAPGYGDAMDALDDAQSDLMDIEFTNPWISATNAYEGLDNQYAEMDNVFEGAKNVFQGAENVYEGKMVNAFEGQKNAYEGMQNMYEDMENAFEDLTVNTQQAEFEAQQMQQSQANIMSQMAGAAGGSGIAALAQSMANQGALQAQQSAASIGAQESQNQKLAAEGQQQIEMATAGEGSKIAMAQAGEQGRLDTQSNQAQMAIQSQVLGADEALQAQRLGEASKLQAMELGEASKIQMAQRDADHLMMMQEAKGAMDIQKSEFDRQADIEANEMAQLTTFMNSQLSEAGLSLQAAQLPQDEGNFGTVMEGVGTAASIKMMFVCIPEGTHVDTVGDTTAIEDINPGDIVVGYDGNPVKVLQKHEYLEDPTKERFYKVKFDNGSIVDVCDMHRIKGVRSKDIIDGVIGKEVYGGVEFSYDLLTEDLGYRIDGIPVNSMIEEMAGIIHKVKKEKVASPLKQLGGGGGGQMDQQSQVKAMQSKGAFEAGMDILAEGQKRKNWEELQIDIRMIEPESMRIRKQKDQLLRDNQKRKIGPDGIIAMPGVEGVANSSKYLKSIFDQVKRWQNALYTALQTDNKELQKKVDLNLAGLKRATERYRHKTQNFYANHFSPERRLSKGVSEQQVSFATQIYCENPEIRYAHAEIRDVKGPLRDYYGEELVEYDQYAIVEDFFGDRVLVNILDGDKDFWNKDLHKTLEYVNFVRETNEKAVEARQSKNSVQIPLGGINYKIDSLFGNNDGTATKEQDQLVLQFCHDDDILKDGSNFRRHLYEHPNIENLNYGGIDFESMRFSQPLGPGDTNYWYDQLDNIDRLNLVDAIVNQDSLFFDFGLLRTLVKEYYTYRVEDAWWKGMGYEKGRLDLMRLKAKKLLKERFKIEKSKAAKDGREEFTFDGRVYPTGADIKKQEAEQKKFIEDNPGTAGVSNVTQ